VHFFFCYLAQLQQSELADIWINIYICEICVFGLMVPQPLMGQDLLYDVPRSQSDTHRLISTTQRPLPENTQHSQETSMSPAGFELAIPSSVRPWTPRLRSHSHWDRQIYVLTDVTFIQPYESSSFFLTVR